jgi:hypothetical protein
MKEEYEVKNAIIESATITSTNNGVLSAWVHLDYGGESQDFGGLVLYVPKTFTHHKIESVSGHFIYRVMQVAGVERWEDLKGKTVRVKASHSKVAAIGHIVKDDWFNPAEDFSEVGE